MDFSIHLPKKDSLKMDENRVKIYSLWVEEGILLLYLILIRRSYYHPCSTDDWNWSAQDKMLT